jgi:site-specific DNA-cytosine methylase
MKKIRILSLFDGLGGARIALERLGIECDYYASEVDSWAIKISSKNYPRIMHLGDVKKINAKDLPKIDLIIGGSPCQDLTTAGNKKGLSGEKSSLFYEFIRLKEEIKPKYFLLENVASMKNSDRDKMSELMGVQPVKINSADFTAQNRNRYYWTNLPIFAYEKSKLVLKDVLEKIDEYHLSKKHHAAFLRSYKWKPTDINGKSKVLMASYYKQPPHAPYIECKNSESGYRMLSPVECERLQGIQDNFTEGVSKTQRYKMIGNGFTIPVIEHLLKGLKNG